MVYIDMNCRNKLVMNRFREIASVRLPGNRFRRRYLSPKGIRPGITLSVSPRLSALRAITLRHRSKADSTLRAMNGFREIASVQLPGNRFRRRHMSPKGIRPGITWSRR